MREKMKQTTFDTEKLVRVLLLYQAVKTNPDISPAQLQEELGVTKSTLSRYRMILRHLGADIVYEKKSRRHVLKRDDFLMAPALSLDERLAIILAVSQLADMQASFVSEQARNAVAKLLAIQDQEVCSACAGLLGQTGTTLRTAPSAVEDTLFKGIIGRKRLRITYAKPREEAETFDMDPYQLFLHDGALYLDGHHWARAGIRRLKACRIQSAEPTGMTFSNMRGYEFSEYKRHVFGIMATGKTPQTVRLRFDATAAPHIREMRRNGQHLTELDNGELLFEVCVEEPREVLWWALRWGESFEVLEPDWLKKEAMEKVRKMARVYGMGVEG